MTNKLAGAGVDMTGAALFDSSGLSVLDRLTAKTLDEVVQAAAGPDQPAMRPLLDVLPIAGRQRDPGRIASSAADPKASSAGWLRAKTGSLTAINSLGRSRHRRQRPRPDVRVHLQPRRPDGPGRPRRPGRRALRTCGCGS